MALNKQVELDQIKADIVKSNVCPDLSKLAKNLVFGAGDPNANIVFIGEAPGKNEDEQGLPFVGQAGKFLDEMLASINLNRSQIYITNIVKYRPPNNRDPMLDEKAAFMPYLEQQLKVINPLVVVTLGRHSTNCFLPDLQISKAHGQPKRIRIKYDVGENDGKKQTGTPVVILPLYHPAAALYDGSMRQTLIDDFAKIPEILKLIRLGLSKTPSSSDLSRTAKNNLSSLDVATSTSLSDKTVFNSPESSPDEIADSRKPSQQSQSK